MLSCGHTQLPDDRYIGMRFDRLQRLVQRRRWLCDDCRYYQSQAVRYRITGQRF